MPPGTRRARRVAAPRADDTKFAVATPDRMHKRLPDRLGRKKAYESIEPSHHRDPPSAFSRTLNPLPLKAFWGVRMRPWGRRTGCHVNGPDQRAVPSGTAVAGLWSG